MKLRSFVAMAFTLMLAAPASAQFQLPPFQLPPFQPPPINPPPINLGHVGPRMITPLVGKEIYQRSPDGRPLIVRVNTASFIANGYGARVSGFRHAVRHAVQRWNEVGAVEPRLEYQTSEGIVGPQHGVINVYMEPGPECTGFGAPIDVNLFTGVSWGGTIAFSAGSGDAQWGPDAELAELTVHELGHTLGLGHTCRDPEHEPTGVVCDCNNPGSREQAVMAGMLCTAFFSEHLHGPTARDLRALRSQNGNALPRTNFEERHWMSNNDAASWTPQSDNFAPNGMSSAPVVAANSGFAAHGYYAIAWRGNDASERLNTMVGYSNSWSHASRRVFDTGTSGSRGQPAIAADGWGNFLVATTQSDSANDALSDERRIAYAMFNGELSNDMPLLDTGSSSSESPGVSFVQTDWTNRYWVLAFAARNGSGVLIRTARQTDPYLPPVPLNWSGETMVFIGTQSVGSLSGIGLACNPVLGSGAEAGRCMFSFATDASRTDENGTDIGNVRTVTFRVDANGTPTGFSFIGFSSVNRTSTTPAMAYNWWAKTFHLGVSQLDSSCWFHNKMAVGASVWPSIACPFQSEGLRPTLSSSLVYSPWWGEVQYFGAE